MDRKRLADVLDRVLAITAEGTSRNPSGYGPPYGPPWYVIDTSTADPDVGWPGDLVEEVPDGSKVGERLREARLDCLHDGLAEIVGLSADARK